MQTTIRLFRSREVSERLVWGVTSGALPPGLSLHASNRNISGTPSQTGSFNFTLRVTDQTPQFDEQNLRIAITSPFSARDNRPKFTAGRNRQSTLS